jgi:Protein of unknown function (DUF3223)
MGKRRRIQIDTRLFEKAGDGTKFFSDMLNRYSIGAIVSPVDSVDLAALLKRHDELTEKVGVGIDHYEVAAAPEGHDGKCFWIVRSNGSRIDFSFKHCLESKPYD